MMEVITSTTKGRMLTTKKKIKCGEIVLKEKPAAWASLLDVKDGYFSTSELSLLTAAKGSGFKGRSSILAARSILCARCEKLIQKGVEQLCYHERDGASVANTAIATSAEIVRRLIACQEPSITTAECIVMLQRLESNAFTIMDEGFSIPVAIGLYLRAAAINHSCDPNCCQTHSFTETTDYDSSSTSSSPFSEPVLFIRAMRDIDVGEELTISYIDNGKPAWWRRDELFASYNFICQCERCTADDPLECYACSVSGCSGSCYISEESLYRLWMNSSGASSATSGSVPRTPGTMLNPPTSSAPSVLGSVHKLISVPVPFGDLLARYCASSFTSSVNHTSAVTSSSSLYDMARSTSSVVSVSDAYLRFVCRKCDSSTNAYQLSTRVASLCKDISAIREKQKRRGREDEEDIITPTLSCLERLTKLVHPTHYSVLDICSGLLLDELLAREMYEQYADIIEEYKIIQCLRLCYPRMHPLPAVQQAMYAKALIYLSRSRDDLSRARQLLMSSLETLTVTHGRDSALVSNVQSLLAGL